MPFTPGEPTQLGGAPPTSGLGQRLANGIRWTAGQVFNPIAERIGRAVDNTVKRWIREAEDALNAQVERIATKLDNVSRADTPGQAIRAMLDPLPLVGIAVGLATAIGAAVFRAAGSWVIVQLKRPLTLLEYQINRQAQLERLVAATGNMAERRGALPRDRVIEDLRDLGWSDDRITGLIAAAGRWLTVGEIEDAYHRGNLDQAAAHDQLRGLGITDDQVEVLFRSFQRIPPATDLVRFVVREVYDPGLRQQQLEGIDRFPQFLADMKRQGFTDFDAASYWAAHWDLPSTTQGYEMFHRLRPGVAEQSFTLEDLRALLVRNDVLPEFVDRLIAIAYNPVTRIDLRRLFRMGIYSRDQVYQGYLDLGYTPAHAEALTDFTTREARSTDRDLTKTEVLNAYKRRLRSRDETADSLADLGYDPEDVELFVAQADYDLLQQRAGRRTTVIRARYMAGLISSADAVNQLSDLGKPPDEVDELITLWAEQLADRAERPTPAQLIGFYRDRVIAGPELDDELRRAGYEDRYVTWYHLQADTQIAEEEARKSEAENRGTLTRAPIPTRGDLANWFRRGIITVEQFTERLLAQGYSAADVAAYAAAVRLPVAIPFYGSPEGRVRVLEAKLEFSRAIIDGAELRRRLQALGYPAELADAIVDYEELKAGA